MKYKQCQCGDYYTEEEGHDCKRPQSKAIKEMAAQMRRYLNNQLPPGVTPNKED